jgi:hypothetical protein
VGTATTSRVSSVCLASASWVEEKFFGCMCGEGSSSVIVRTGFRVVLMAPACNFVSAIPDPHAPPGFVAGEQRRAPQATVWFELLAGGSVSPDEYEDRFLS